VGRNDPDSLSSSFTNAGPSGKLTRIPVVSAAYKGVYTFE